MLDLLKIKPAVGCELRLDHPGPDSEAASSRAQQAETRFVPVQHIQLIEGQI